jgi:hypothetical protein
MTCFHTRFGRFPSLRFEKPAVCSLTHPTRLNCFPSVSHTEGVVTFLNFLSTCVCETWVLIWVRLLSSFHGPLMAWYTSEVYVGKENAHYA